METASVLGLACFIAACLLAALGGIVSSRRLEYDFVFELEGRHLDVPPLLVQGHCWHWSSSSLRPGYIDNAP